MKVLIQHRASLLYWDGEDAWVANAAKARAFKTTSEAIERAINCKLKNIHLVLKFPKPAYNMTIPFDKPVKRRSRL